MPIDASVAKSQHSRAQREATLNMQMQPIVTASPVVLPTVAFPSLYQQGFEQGQTHVFQGLLCRILLHIFIKIST